MNNPRWLAYAILRFTLGCVFLFFSLSLYTQTLFASWTAFGLLIYYGYGYSKSNIAVAARDAA